MATRDLDRWLLNQGPYPEPQFGHGTDEGKIRFGANYGAGETVQPTNTSKRVERTNRSVQSVYCMHFGCYKRSERIGAQDFCDIYKCEDGHINRYEVGKGVRHVWTETEGSGTGANDEAQKDVEGSS